MPNVIIVDSNVKRNRSNHRLVHEAVAEADLASVAITTAMIEEEKVNCECFLLYGFSAGRMAEAKKIASAITMKTGVKVRIAVSECRSVLGHKWMPYLALYADEERMDLIAGTLTKGPLEHESGLDQSGFDLEKHLLRQDKDEEILEQKLLFYIRVVCTKPENIQKIVDALVRHGYPETRIFTKQLAGFEPVRQ
jgi:hypothetical protein